MKCIVEMDALGRFHVVYEPEPVKVEPAKVEPAKGYGTATKVNENEIASIWVAQSDDNWRVEDSSFSYSDGGITVRVKGYQWKESSTDALLWLVEAIAHAAYTHGYEQGRKAK